MHKKSDPCALQEVDDSLLEAVLAVGRCGL